jgi:hypothetical protein
MATLPCNCGKPTIEGYRHCLHCWVHICADRGETSTAYAIGLASGLSEQQVDEILYESSDFALWACGVGHRAAVGRTV